MVGETEQTDNSLSKKEVTYTDLLFGELLQKISITCLYYVYISTIIYYRPPPHVHKSVLHYEHAIITVHRVSISFSLPIVFIKQVWEVWV